MKTGDRSDIAISMYRVDLSKAIEGRTSESYFNKDALCLGNDAKMTFLSPADEYCCIALAA